MNDGPDPNLPLFPDEPFDWEAELAIPSVGQDEELPDPAKTLDVDSRQLGWDLQHQELAWLLSVAIARLGGALVITDAERKKHPHYSLGVDVAFTNTTGGIRIFSVFQGEEGVDGTST
jgi:hypothetical protein